MKQEKQAVHLWEIRDGKSVKMRSGIENCGYTLERLQHLKRSGYSLYRDGKRVKI